MRSIGARFNGFKQASKGHSSFIVFSRTIKGQQFTKTAISRWFGKLVEKGDYEKSDKMRLLKHLYVLNIAVEAQKQPQNRVLRGFFSKNDTTYV